MTQNDKKFLEILKKYRRFVWIEIKKYLDQSPKFLYSLSPKEHGYFKDWINFQQDLISEYPKRQGKYFRPTLVLLMAEALGVPKEYALKTAAAMQLSEEWLLIQDDFEDNSLKRRGKPCLHKMYSPELAINASTVLFLIMWQILIDNTKIIGFKKAIQIQKEFQKFLLRTTLGQTIEIKSSQENTTLSKKEILFIMKGKTGYYTVGGPLRLGAIVANPEPKFLKALTRIGNYLGTCYQIQDDILDLTSDFSGRKIQYNDLYEGKRTMILCHLFSKCAIEEKKNLTKILAKNRKEKTDQDIKNIMSLIKKHGSIDYAQKKALKYAQKAKNIFDQTMRQIPVSEAKNNLKLAFDFVVNRRY